MAILLLNETKLEPVSTPLPLTKYFLRGLGVIFVIAMHLYSLTDISTDQQVLSNAAVWIVLAITSAIGLYHIACHGYARFSLMSIGLFAACLLLTLPLFYLFASPYPALGRVIGLWAGWGLFVLLQQFVLSHQQKQGLLFFILIGALIQAVWVGFQLLFPSLGLGASEHVYGVFKSADKLTSFLITGLALSGYLIARQAQTKEDKS
ncbi:MAG: ligase, partial [Vibrio sp.]